MVEGAMDWLAEDRQSYPQFSLSFQTELKRQFWLPIQQIIQESPYQHLFLYLLNIFIIYLLFSIFVQRYRAQSFYKVFNYYVNKIHHIKNFLFINSVQFLKNILQRIFVVYIYKMLSFNKLLKISRVVLQRKLFNFSNLIVTDRQQRSPNQPKMNGLSKLQQKALISYAALNFIMNFSEHQLQVNSSSLRERLVNRAIFKKFIKQTYGEELESILDDDCFDQVLSGFQINAGAIYNEVVFSQLRFKMAEITTMIQNGTKLKEKQQNARIILNPLSYTGKIIKKIIDSRAIIISGEKGTGKSFSYLIYTYLFKYIYQLRIKPEYPYSNLSIFKWIEKTKFQRLPKISYFPLKQINSYQDIIEVLEQQNQKRKNIQIPKQVQIKGEKSIGLFRLQKYLEQIKNMDNNYGIKFRGIVIDEANHYYSLLRQLVKNNLDEKQSLQQNMLTDYMMNVNQKAYLISNVFTETSSFIPNIHNSSQSVERKFILEFNKTSKIKFYNIFQNEVSENLEHKIKLKSYLRERAGQVQLYGIFWFTIQSKMQLNGVPYQQIKSYRKIFNKIFGLPHQIQEEKQISSTKILQADQNDGNTQKQAHQTINNTKDSQIAFSEWNNDVRFLNIRVVLEKISYKQIVAYFSGNNTSQKLMELRQNIQKHRSQIFDGIFENFFEKSAEFEKLERRKFLLYISGKLQSIIKDKQKNKLNRVQFFIPDTAGFTNAFQQQLRQSLDVLILDDREKKGFSCIIYCNPILLTGKVNICLQKLLTKMINHNKILMQKGGYNASTIGSNFELLLGVLVLFGKVKLNFQQFYLQGSQLTRMISFNIFDVSRIETKWSDESFENSMESFLQKMKQNPGKYIGGLPMKQKEDILNNTNFFFDFAIGKYNSPSRNNNNTPSLQIRIIDYTFGSLSRKSITKRKTICKFMEILKNLDTDCLINIHFHIASPTEYVKKYIQHLQLKDFAQAKYNFYQLPSECTTNFKAVLLGIPDIAKLISFEGDYIYRIDKRSTQILLIECQSIIYGMVNSASHNKTRLP